MENIYDIVDLIIDLSNRDCEGCKYNWCSQKHHSCINDSWATKVITYFNRAIQQLNISYTPELYAQVSTYYNGTSYDCVL